MNKGWVTVGPYYVRFEKWNNDLHSMPKFIASYGGWLRFRGIPLHAWNLKTFTQIGDAYGGFEAIGMNTRRKLDLIEASIYRHRSELLTRKVPASS